MASMGVVPPSPDQLTLRIRDGRLLNAQLKNICSKENLKSSGVKAELQNRIIDHLKDLVFKGENVRYQRVAAMILETNPANPGGQQYRGDPFSSPAAPSPAPPQHVGYGFGLAAITVGTQRLYFKKSPFYDIQAQVGSGRTLEIMKEHRHSVTIHIRPEEHPLMNNIPADTSLRIMVFCTSDSQGQTREVSFPHQSELKVNSADFKANLRGLKNKPGSTRPVDITDALRFKPERYMNSVDLTYALSDKKYYFGIAIVKKVHVDDLVKKLRAGYKKSKQSVLNDMQKKVADDEVETTSTVMSLKCPLSTMRIDLPIRSSNCRHNACFDASSYLQLQEQGPTWLCPICNRSAPFDNLIVDEYVVEILAKTSKSIDQVTIESNGEWSETGKAKVSSSKESNGSSFSDDEDLIEIRDDRVQQLKHENSFNGSMTPTGTPALDKHMIPGLAPPYTPPPPSNRPPGSHISAKRPASAVIDLTLSDDEEEPVRAPKRTYGSSNYVMPQNSFNPYQPNYG